MAASGGIATFSNLSIDKGGLGYTLTASDNRPRRRHLRLLHHHSGGAGPLAFGVQPSNTVAGVAISPAGDGPGLDQFGNLVTNDSSDQVTLTVASGPGGFAASSTTTVTASGGVATFSNLVLNTAGTYTLSESGSGGLTGPASTSFTVIPAAADHLVFGVQPSNTVAGVAISPAVTVKVFDHSATWSPTTTATR